jgi:hypothetical protein
MKGTHIKKLTLLLLGITQVFTVYSSENFKFRDGTSIEGHIYAEKGFEPDEHGIILNVNNMVYVHHYPVMDRSLSCPLYYYGGPNPFVSTGSCTPSRISFFHFETFTLAGVRESVTKMSIPTKKKKKALDSIDKALSGEIPKVMTNPKLISHSSTKKWEMWVEIYLGREFKKKTMVWGKSLHSLKEYDLKNRSLSFSKKRR